MSEAGQNEHLVDQGALAAATLELGHKGGIVFQPIQPAGQRIIEVLCV
ncbi:MAG: hypothetical protein AB7U73_14790 [Pirellulales bacterium]